MTILILFYIFFLVGAFGFGGGYGMLSLLQYEMVTSRHWMSSAEFAEVVAVSQSSPDFMGVNSAVYSGYVVMQRLTDSVLMGVAGGCVAAVAVVLPSVIIVLAMWGVMRRYACSQALQSVSAGLRLAVVGLLAASMLLMCNKGNFNAPSQSAWHFWVSALIFVVTFIGVKVKKINPVRMMLYAAFAGLLLLY